MQDYEKLGQFYLGQEYDLSAGERAGDLLLYDAKDLCTHAVCVGMTGSGKTGLCLSLLEEAAIDGIPVLAIDPKGDLGNLMLTFPDLKGSDFEPWVDSGDAERKGQSPADYAQSMADLWKKGLADWGQDPERIQKFRDSAEVAIYTPASNAGIPVTVLRSFNAPAEATRDDDEAMREHIMAAVSGLLALMKIKADPISSREHILLSNILDHNWREGTDVPMGELLRQIQSPPFEKVGFMDLETFFPEKERFGLSMQINNLLASPNFQAWLKGEPLDIQRILYTPEGKPRIAIMSIAHLTDDERMFFVTILLNEYLAWMRAQPGTSSLRALLYMDEVFGYFPPVANPPSKQPMLTLLKQARAFGCGVVLATQNPVDLDYKGLSNCGTWFLGRLQTERDKARVMEGLEGASAQAGSTFDKKKMEETLAGLGSRVFLMNNVHEDQPVVFHSRWALSYLRGPVTRDQIEILMDPIRDQFKGSGSGKQSLSKKNRKATRPVIPPGIKEYFLPLEDEPDDDQKVIYRPALFGCAKLHYSKTSIDVDMYKEVCVLQVIDDKVKTDAWDDATVLEIDEPDLEDDPEKAVEFDDLPADMTQKTNYTAWKHDLKDHLYRSYLLPVFSCKALKATSKPGESEGDFRIRLMHSAREARDVAIEKLRKKYSPKIASARERLRKAEQRVETQKAQEKSQLMNTAISIGTGLLGALFGRKLGSSTNATRMGSAARSAGRIAREKGDVRQAQETVDEYFRKMEDLEVEFNDEVDKMTEEFDTDNLDMEDDSLRPRKSDLKINTMALVWTPWIIDEGEDADEGEEAYQL